VANLANAISAQCLGDCTAEARLPGGGQALRARRKSVEEIILKQTLCELGVSVVNTSAQ